MNKSGWGLAINPEHRAAVCVIGAFLLAVLCANTTTWYPAYIVTGGSWGSVKGFAEHMLMPLFFLKMVMEIQKERAVGILSAGHHQLVFPAMAAVGGMVFPAALYAWINLSDPIAVWGIGIPAATDIVFALCAFDLLAGQKLPHVWRVFLLAVALFDDLGAIALIAGIYQQGHWNPMAWLGLLGVGVALIGWRRMLIQYPEKTAWGLIGGIAGGVSLVTIFHVIGWHTTLAGVCLGSLVPYPRQPHAGDYFARTEKWLHIAVSYGILPIFAFTVGGLELSGLGEGGWFFHPVFWGVVGGLAIGKPLGILAVAACFRCWWPHMLPPAVDWSWRAVGIVGMLCGIGFTMSLLIGQLAFADQPALQHIMKIGVMGGSGFALLGAWGLLWRYPRSIA